MGRLGNAAGPTGELMQPLVARCRLGLGILHAQAAQRERTKVELDVTGRLFRDMAMDFWLARVADALDRSP